MLASAPVHDTRMMVVPGRVGFDKLATELNKNIE